jgi:GT2 family glycosyltransferase
MGVIGSNSPTPLPETAHVERPKISVVILNYNGLAWLPRCFESLLEQTFLDQIEVIVVDNASSDGSDGVCEEWLKRFERGRIIRNATNLYFCGGNNVGAGAAAGEFVLFLNFDLWLQPDCLERLYHDTVSAQADASTPLVLDYEDGSFQNAGASGLDWMGIITHLDQPKRTTEVLVACGCSLMVRRELFLRIGGFPEEHLMYAEEADLCWRVWLAGGKVVTVPSARLHHRGAALANPEGHTKIVEARTSETKRYLANRNTLLVLLKNCQGPLLLLIFPHLLLLSFEAFASLLLFRRWAYVRRSYLSAVTDAFRMLPVVQQRRAAIRTFRKRGDFWMLRFLRLKPGRWDEVKRLFAFGTPKVDAK